MGQTMIQKVLARKAGRDHVEAGETVVCSVDLTILGDGPFSLTNWAPPLAVPHPDRVGIVLDHGVPAASVLDAQNGQRARAFAQKFGIERFFDIGRHGIVHALVAEQALAVPGDLMTCNDSHTVAAGALNVAGRGLGGPEVWQIVCRGETWFRVPEVVRYDLVGSLPEYINGKDVFLHIAGEYGEAFNQAIEFGGTGLATFPMNHRRTLAAQCVELAAEFAMFPADQVLEDYLAERTDRPYSPVAPDDDAEYVAHHEIDLSSLVSYVALPNAVADNVMPVSELDLGKIDQCFIGSCANGQIEDIEIAAKILDGRQVDPSIRLIVTPASQKVYIEASERGYLATLVKAGATVTNPTCGACNGGHMGVLGPGEVCVTSSTRNFRGRMGSPDAEVYMASPAVVASTAVAGRLTDPHDLA